MVRYRKCCSGSTPDGGSANSTPADKTPYSSYCALFQGVRPIFLDCIRNAVTATA